MKSSKIKFLTPIFDNTTTWNHKSFPFSIDYQYFILISKKILIQVLGLNDSIDLSAEPDMVNRNISSVEISKISGSGGAIALNVKEGMSTYDLIFGKRVLTYWEIRGSPFLCTYF